MKNCLRAILLSATLLSGCALWQMVGGPYAASSENYEVNLPGGWRKHNPSGDLLRLTRDGLELQQMIIGRWPVDKEPPHTKRKLSSAMLPQEVAEVVVDDFRSNTNLFHFEIIENSPSTVGDYPGFKLVYRFQSKSGLKKKGAYYGALSDGWLYYLSYVAAERHYFAKDSDAFEEVKETFRILNARQP